MPRILVCLLEIARTFAHGRRYGYGIVRVLREHVCEKHGHPLFNCVWEAVDDGANTEDRGMSLPERWGVLGRLTRGEISVVEQPDKSVLKGDNTMPWRKTNHPRQCPVFHSKSVHDEPVKTIWYSRRCHLPYFNDLVV